LGDCSELNDVKWIIASTLGITCAAGVAVAAPGDAVVADFDDGAVIRASEINDTFNELAGRLAALEGENARLRAAVVGAQYATAPVAAGGELCGGAGGVEISVTRPSLEAEGDPVVEIVGTICHGALGDEGPQGEAGLQGDEGLQGEPGTPSPLVDRVVEDFELTVGPGEGPDFPTLRAALESLERKIIPPGERVEIQLEIGEHAVSGELDIDHPQGRQIHIVGQGVVPDATEIVCDSANYCIGVVDGAVLGLLANVKLTRADPAGTAFMVYGSSSAFLRDVEVENFSFGLLADVSGFVRVERLEILDASSSGVAAARGSMIWADRLIARGRDEGAAGNGVSALSGAIIWAPDAQVTGFGNNFLSGDGGQLHVARATSGNTSGVPYSTSGFSGLFAAGATASISNGTALYVKDGAYLDISGGSVSDAGGDCMTVLYGSTVQATNVTLERCRNRGATAALGSFVNATSAHLREFDGVGFEATGWSAIEALGTDVVDAAGAVCDLPAPTEAYCRQ
jgi:hypothetical protein